MDPERERWILEQLALKRRGAIELGRLSTELYFHYRNHISPEDARRRLDKRVRETRVQLARDFARDPKAPLPPEPKPHNKGGRKANVTPALKRKMRAMRPEELAAKKNEEMVADFGHSLSTLRKARNEVLGDNWRARLLPDSNT